MDIDSSFIRIAADWPAEHALALLSAFPDLHHVIVHRLDEHKGEFVYAYDYTAIVQELTARRELLVIDALNLHEYTATPVAHRDGGEPPDRVVVLDRGKLVGVGEPTGTGVSGGFRDIAANGGDPSSPSAQTKPRGLSAKAPARLELGATKSLLVKISAAGDTAGAAATIAAATGDDITLVVETSGAVEVKEPSEVTIKLTDEEITTRFELTASRLGIGRVLVRAFKGSREVAIVTATTEVVAAGESVALPAIERRVAIQPGESPPDLDVEIEEDKDKRTYRIKLTAAKSELGLNRVKFGPITLDTDVDKFFSDFYADIEKILSGTDGPSGKMAALAQKGVYLFEKIVPPDMRKRLWDVRDKIKTVQIQSEEPWVPWELCRLSGTDAAGMIAEGGFIAEQYEVTRWFLAQPQHRKLTLASIGLVVPPDSGLRAAPAEERELLALATGGRAVTKIKSEAVELRKALASAQYDALHFVGHGAADAGNADRSSLKLEAGARFRPEDLAGQVANLGAKKPIVFLNACEVGRSGTALGGLAGWPQGFIKAGAGAFIGPLWKIADATASQFATELYAKLLAGETVGRAVHHARTVVRDANDPTWLAYIAYAHPDAKIA